MPVKLSKKAKRFLASGGQLDDRVSHLMLEILAKTNEEMEQSNVESLCEELVAKCSGDVERAISQVRAGVLHKAYLS